MRLKVLLVFILFVLSIVFTAGCREEVSVSNYTDDLGRNVQINKIPQRIISLAPSNTEIVYALGLEDKLIGVTTYCNYPEAVKDKPRVSDYSDVDIEKIVSLQPDLILADNIHKSTIIPALEKLNIPVLGIDPQNLDRIIKDIELIGNVSGRTKSASELISNLQNRVQKITAKTSKLDPADRPGVFFLTWADPLWTEGSGTLMNDLIEKAGGINIASDLSAHSQIALEAVVERNPRYILVMSSMGTQNISLEFLKAEPRFKATDALKNNQVYPVDSDIFGRTTPRSVDALEQMAAIFHPELFK